MHVYPFPKICQSHGIYTVAPALRDWHEAEANSWIDHCSTESTRIVEMFVCCCYCYCYCWYNYCFDLLLGWQLLWHRRHRRRHHHHQHYQYKGQHYCRHCLPPSLLRLSICHFCCDFFCHNWTWIWISSIRFASQKNLYEYEFRLFVGWFFFLLPTQTICCRNFYFHVSLTVARTFVVERRTHLRQIFFVSINSKLLLIFCRFFFHFVSPITPIGAPKKKHKSQYRISNPRDMPLPWKLQLNWFINSSTTMDSYNWHFPKHFYSFLQCSDCLLPLLLVFFDFDIRIYSNHIVLCC